MPGKRGLTADDVLNLLKTVESVFIGGSLNISANNPIQVYKDGDNSFLKQTGNYLTNPGTINFQNMTGGIQIQTSDNSGGVATDLTIEHPQTKIFNKVVFDKGDGTNNSLDFSFLEVPNYAHSVIEKHSYFDPGSLFFGGNLIFKNNYGTIEFNASSGIRLKYNNSNRISISSSSILFYSDTNITGELQCDTLRLDNDIFTVSNLPTSSSGLTPGQVWIDTANGNVLKVA